MPETLQETHDGNLSHGLMAAVEERFDVEAVAQAVERIRDREQLDTKLDKLSKSSTGQIKHYSASIRAIQHAIQDLRADVLLMKRAMAWSSGDFPVFQDREAVPLPSSTDSNHITPETKDLGQDNLHSSAKHSDTSTPSTEEADDSAAPPDFSELRDMKVPEPTNIFVPPAEEPEQDTASKLS